MVDAVPDYKTGKFQSVPLYVPPLAEVASFLQEKLGEHFREATVSVSACPDLRQSPFGLSSEGLGGSPIILQVGGVRNLLPVAKKHKVYDLQAVADRCAPHSTFLGAGAGPYRLLGRNSECIINFRSAGEKSAFECHNYVAQLREDGTYDCGKCDEPQIAFLGDSYASQGQPSEVLHITLKHRTSAKSDFVSLVRELLVEKYGTERSMGLGGVFILKSGKAKLHIMQSCIPDGPIDTASFLAMFEVSAPLVGLGMLVTNDCGMQLREVHFHMFGTNERSGGHYHYDLTPEEAEYEAYFAFAERAAHFDTSE